MCICVFVCVCGGGAHAHIKLSKNLSKTDGHSPAQSLTEP